MRDLIERKAAIDEALLFLVEYCGAAFDEDMQNKLYQRLILLPSAQPEMNFDEWCTDCKEYDQERHCCPRFNRVIRQTLKDAQAEIVRCKDCMHYGIYYRGIESEPVITHLCKLCLDRTMEPDDYCSHAERRTDGEAVSE